MNLIEVIKDILKPLDVPISYLRYDGRKEKYIKFSFYGDKDPLYADDQEEETAIYIQIDIFAKNESRYLSLCEQLKQIMRQHKDFFKNGTSPDMYEKDTKLYHKAYRFLYYM